MKIKYPLYPKWRTGPILALAKLLGVSVDIALQPERRQSDYPNWPAANAQQPADMNMYAADHFPVDGCSLVLTLSKKDWGMTVYAPGFKPSGWAGVLSTYARRPHGSAGSAVDGFIANGGDWKPMLAKMMEAERAYSSVSGSIVTL